MLQESAVKNAFAQLLAHGGTYARLWQRQSGGFTDVDAAVSLDATAAE